MRGKAKVMTEEDVVFIIENSNTLTITDIAKKLGVSSIRVSNILKQISKEYVREDGEEILSGKGKKISSLIFDAAQKLNLKKK